MEDDRIRFLNERSPDREEHFVLYWMQQSQRLAYSCALEYAIRLANERDQSLTVGFGLADDCPEANERPWQERPLFGKVRYMNAGRLRPKFDIEAYVRWADGLNVPTGNG